MRKKLFKKKNDKFSKFYTDFQIKKLPQIFPVDYATDKQHIKISEGLRP